MPGAQQLRHPGCQVRQGCLPAPDNAGHELQAVQAAGTMAETDGAGHFQQLSASECEGLSLAEAMYERWKPGECNRISDPATTALSCKHGPE